jgi:tryptophan-rich sensory protein
MSSIPKLVASIAIALAAGALGNLFTASAIPTWYAALNKPSFNPPSWLFAPVWGILYILMGVSLYLIWKRGTKTKKVRDAIYVFGVQLFLNAIWSPIFFGAKSIFFALIVIILMWVYIIRTIGAFIRVDRTAGYLLYPYLVWVSFATILNFSIWILNM